MKLLDNVMKVVNDTCEGACIIAGKVSHEVQITTSAATIKGNSLLADLTTAVVSGYRSFRNFAINESYGFVLCNELKNRNKDKNISLNNGVVSVKYGDNDLKLSVSKDGKIVNVEMLNQSVNLKYDFERLINGITNDKPIKEWGELIEGKVEEQPKEHKEAAKVLTKEDLLKEYVYENPQDAIQAVQTGEQTLCSSLFEDGNGITVEVIDDSPMQIISPEVEASDHQCEENVFIQSQEIIKQQEEQATYEEQVLMQQQALNQQYQQPYYDVYGY